MYSSSEHSLVDHYVDVPPGFDFDAEFDDGVVSPGHREDRDTRHAPCNDCQLFGESIFYERLEAGLCVVLDEGLPRFQRYAQQGRLIELGYAFDGVTRCWWPKGVMVQCIESKPSAITEKDSRSMVLAFDRLALSGICSANSRKRAISEVLLTP